MTDGFTYPTAVDAEMRERLGGRGRRAEVEDAPRRRPPAFRDAALEIDKAEVCLVRSLEHLRSEQRLRRDLAQPRGDAAAEHRVPGESESHDRRAWPAAKIGRASCRERV